MDPFAVSKVCACICLVSGEAKLIIYEAKKTSIRKGTGLKVFWIFQICCEWFYPSEAAVG